MRRQIGLLGRGIGYSLSPILHGAAAKAAGLNWEYLLLDTEPDKLGAAVDKLRRPDWAGANVTVPYKLAVMDMLDQIDAGAMAAGAVNTIVNCGGRLTGYNTDVPGLARDLNRLNIHAEGKDVAVVGAGGAAAAVLSLTRGSRLQIICRRREQGAALTQTLKTSAEILPWVASPPCCDLLFNCTPPGSGWQKFAHGSSVIYDLNYHETAPPPGTYYNGLGMLVFQAAESFRLWTGIDPVLEMAAAAGLIL